MNRSVVLAATLALLGAACWNTRQNPLYCDATTACAEPALYCDEVKHECLPIGDAGIDMQGAPDLLPMCSADLGCSEAQRPICDDSARTCRACAAGECGGSLHCSVASGACVECLVEADCVASQGVCSATSTCVACKANADCGSGLCDEGKCAPEASVAYVDNAGAPCAGATGSKAMPFCEINPAIAAGKPYVRVAGSAVPYQAIVITGTGPIDVRIVGPGKAAAPRAMVSQTGLSGLAVQPAAGNATVVVHGLEIIGANSPVRPGVICSGAVGTASLTLRDSYIHTSGAIGVDSSACTIKLSRNLITDNRGGINIVGGSYTIENNFIVQNASSVAPGVSFDNASSGVFRFNTVANNLTSTASVVAGIACGSAGKAVSDSIVIGNTKATTSQFEGSCTLTNVVTGTDSAPGASQLIPAFVSGTDFHLQPGNQACCSNKVAGGPAVDVDNEARPKGSSWDIGADEVE